MDQDRELNLDLSEDVLTMIEEIGQKAGCNEEQVIEYVLREYLMYQLTVIEKRAEETGSTMNDLVNQQFARLVEFLHSHPDQFRQN